MTDGFINFTDVDDTEARKILSEKRDLVLRGQADREQRQVKDEEHRNMWLNNIWTDEQLDDFFKQYDLTPYNIGVHRPIVNNLISKQRSRKITFEFVPSDIYAYKRHRKGREQFIIEEMSKEDSLFETEQKAGEFFDRYGDDKYSKAVTSFLHNIRQENKAKYIETEVFQSGLISGLDFFKCVYGRGKNRNGGIEITRRPQSAVFFDESTTEYDLKDIEYIGEIHRLYKNDLKVQYPDYTEEIEKYFKHYTSKDRPLSSKQDRKWEYFYDFNASNASESRVRVAELWTLESETRLVVIDNEEGTTRVVDYGIDEDAIIDNLLSMTLIELQEEAKYDPQIAEMLQEPNIREMIQDMVDQRYEITQTTEPIFYKTVFTYNGLLEHKRSPLPHGSHPYFPFYAQHTEGEFTSLMEDIKDIVIGINKALAFRELMMAHGAKGLVIIDQKAFAKSGYDINDIAEQYSSIGGIMMVDLKPNVSVNDIINVVTTVGDGLDAINFILQDLDNRLMRVSGVTLEQMGIVQRETTSSGYRAQVQEGETNNGLLFDNFYRSMESFYNDKVIPLVTDMMNKQPERVIRRIGHDHEPWIDITPEENLDFFDTAVRTGQYNTVLKPVTDNPQLQEERASKYMEMAMAGLLDPELAIEFSTDPDRFKLLKKMKKKELERARREAFNQFTMQEFFQAAGQTDLPFDALQELLDTIKKNKAKEMKDESQPSGQQIQRQQGGQGAQAAPVTRTSARESSRQGNIDRAEQNVGA